MKAEVALIRPKFDHNLGQIVRACSFFGVGCVWTTRRLEHPARLPRELRGLYPNVSLARFSRLQDILTLGTVPVAVEFRSSAEPLQAFVHPEETIYLFGPEDGEIPSGHLALCYRVVTIPGPHSINIAAAVHLVLYDRLLKEGTR
jgi:tRNA(Leu) C34 or U34 (ribose-2'-O)-methylase TrmL